MNGFDRALQCLEKGDISGALDAADAFCTRTKAIFMEELTVNTATDYVGAVLLFSKVCTAEKKPWKATRKLDECEGALHFLQDFMADRETLSETYHAVALSFERAAFLPETVSYYRNEAMTTEDRQAFLTALYQAFFFQARFGKEIPFDTAPLLQKISATDLDRIAEQAKKEAASLMKIDPVESEDDFLACRFEVEEKVDEILSREDESDLPFCLRYWNTKKKVLSENFGIAWLSPAEMNPEIRFV